MTTRPTQLELEQARQLTVDDVLPADLRLLFVGINPGLWSAWANAHFARPGNRFWPALAAAGLTDGLWDVSSGMTSDEVAALSARGIGITNIVRRTTARADELSAAELRAGAEELTALVARHRPHVVAIAGITAYRTAFHRPRARMGEQEESIAGARLFIVPNPSGLNAHETVASLAAAYGAAADAAGVWCDVHR